MRKQTLLFVLAGAALSAIPSSAATAADECVAKPTAAPPAGRHWYYRTERPSQRKCWYLGDAGAKTIAVAPQKEAASEDDDAPPKQESAAQAASPNAKSDVQRPIANARAELIDTPPTEQPAAPPAQRQPDVVPDVTGGMTSRAWLVASRWADATNPSAFGTNAVSGNPAPAQAPDQKADASTDQKLIQRADAQTTISADKSAAPAAEPVQAPAEDTGGIDYLLLALCVSMLAFAAFMGLMLFRSSRRLDPDDFPSASSAKRGRRSSEDLPTAFNAPVYFRADAVPNHGSAPVRPPRRLDDEIEELEQMLAAARQTSATTDQMAWDRR